MALLIFSRISDLSKGFFIKYEYLYKNIYSLTRFISMKMVVKIPRVKIMDRAYCLQRLEGHSKPSIVVM